MKCVRYLGIVAMLAGLVSLVIGIVFIAQSVSVNEMLTKELAAEKMTTTLPKEGEEGYIKGNVVDTAKEAEAVSALILGHVRGEKQTTYLETARGSPERATYLDGMALMNSLNLAVMGFGVATIALASGVVMITTGLALGGAGFGLYRLSGRVS